MLLSLKLYVTQIAHKRNLINILRQIQVKLVTNTSEVQIAHFNLHLTNNVTIKFIRVFLISEIKLHFHLYLTSM